MTKYYQYLEKCIRFGLYLALLGLISTSAQAESIDEAAEHLVELKYMFLTPKLVNGYPQGILEGLVYQPEEDSIFMPVSFYAEWGWVIGIHPVELRIFDGSGRKVDTAYFHVTDPGQGNIMVIDFDLTTDSPGVWKFELWELDQLLGSAEIEIVTDHQDFSFYGQGLPLVAPFPEVDPARVGRDIEVDMRYEISVNPAGEVIAVNDFHKTGSEYLDNAILKAAWQIKFIPHEFNEVRQYDYAQPMSIEVDKY